MIWVRLLSLAPEVEESLRREPVARNSEDEVAKYVANLRILRRTIEKIRCAMLARRMELDTARLHLDRLQGFVGAFQKTI